MKVRCRKGVAIHPDPESCGAGREAVAEALTGEAAGQPLSREIGNSGVPTQLCNAEGNIASGVCREPFEDSTRSKTLRMRRSPSYRNWDISSAPDSNEPRKGTSGKACGRNPEAEADEKSDACIVPMNDPNNGGGSKPLPAEGREGRRAAKSNAGHPPAPRTQSRTDASMGLDGVREAARKGRNVRFTALMHHITPELLTDSFRQLKRSAAAGVDGVTWREYEDGLADRIALLWDAVQAGRYRAQPSRRVFIPKPDGRQRPLGIAALEDKIVQQAVVTVLTAIYEADFLGFSYGFRPGRNQHHALDALCVGLTQKRVNWVLDADITSFFDTIDHGWMIQFLEHRIADQRMLRMIRKWLNAGVVESGIRTATKIGTPQGAVISPLLANVYLHYVFDLWTYRWRRQDAKGDVIVVRYADDSVMGFEFPEDARTFLDSLRVRLGQFGLALNEAKTRILEFGRYAIERRARRGQRRPETFDFLGFTHICGRRRENRTFIVRRQTVAKRMTATLKAIRASLMRRRHAPKGDVIVVRYADDSVMGFEFPEDARTFLDSLRVRLGQFGLALNEAKTRILEFGRYAIERRARRGQRRPETFDFLGFTHICGRRRENRTFIVRRQTVAKRMTATLKAIRASLMRRRHAPVRSTGMWLKSVVQGYLNYYAVPENVKRLGAFRAEVCRAWLHTLRRRSQRSRMTWERMRKLADRYVPKVRALHPYPHRRIAS